MAETTWGDEGAAPPKKSGVPTWVWFCGGGCLLAVVLAVIVGGFLFTKAKGMVDPEQQWPKVAEILPFDERPPELELQFGWNIGMGMYMFSDKRGFMHVLMHLPEQDAEQSRRQIMDPSFSGGVFGVGGRKDAQAGTIDVQGRKLSVLRFYQSEAGGESGGESTPGAPKKPSGASIMVDLTPEDAARPLILQMIRTNAKEPISDEDVIEILRPFHVGPNR